MVVNSIQEQQSFLGDILGMRTLRYRDFPDGSANGFSGVLNLDRLCSHFRPLASENILLLNTAGFFRIGLLLCHLGPSSRTDRVHSQTNGF
jgi:hypothetical protein